MRDWNKPGNIKNYIGQLNWMRKANAALLQTDNLRFASLDDAEVIGFVKESPARDNAVAVAIALSGAGPRQFWFHFGDIEIGPDGRARPRRGHRESRHRGAHHGRMGRRAAAHRSGARPRPPVPLPCVKGEIVDAASEIKVEHALDADELWFKDAIIYQLHVKAFADSNSDGIGDFVGLTEKLDYLQDLGVTALWLLPFFPSPGRDDGYDIADYRNINPDFGAMKDFRRFMQEAKRRKLRIIIELVINHTSDQHPWFQRARASRPGSDARNWYVWSDTDQRYAGTRIIFNDAEKSNWAWDPVAQAYYWHRFFSHQPDLNFDNPNVLAAMVQVVRRWLDLGVDGFRLDAIPYLCEREGTSNENLPETHAVIKRIRAELDAHAPGKLLLAEANQWPEDVAAYFGDGDECHMAYHFPLMPRIYMAIAQEDRFPITDIVRQTPDIPANCQWALFLRNHDELTLEMVTDVERDYLWSTYASDPRARINLGIRRRLAPLMDNDRRKIELVNSLLAVVSRHPDHLLRRRDRDGRQHLSGRPQRRAHPDAMDAGPQRRLLALRPGAAVPAHHHGPGLRLRSRERGGAVAQHRLAAELDQAADLGAQVEPGLRPRLAVLHPHPQPLGDGLCPAIRERGHPVRRQPVALRAGDRDRSRAVARPRPARDAGPQEFPADRRPALCGHARPLRILLVLSLRAVGRDRIAEHRAGVRDPGGHRGLALALARPRPRDPGARRAAGLPGEPALVSRPRTAPRSPPSSPPPSRSPAANWGWRWP